MAEERQQQRSAQPDGQNQQVQRRGAGQQTGMARRGGIMPSIFNMDPFDMLRASPFALMRRLSEDMDQWFGQLGMGRGGQGMAAGGGLFAPPIEMCERDGNLVVCVDLPGLTKDDIHVEVTENALVIEGERRSEHEERQGGAFHSERRYGRFHRQIPLPEGVNAEQAKASFKDGVLEVTMPAPQRQPRGRQIEIQSGAPSSTGQPAASNAAREHAQTNAGGSE